MLAVTRLHQIAHNRNLVFRHGPNLHQIQTLHGILAHKLLLGIETAILSHQSCWQASRSGVRFLLTASNNSCWPVHSMQDILPSNLRKNFSYLALSNRSVRLLRFSARGIFSPSASKLHVMRCNISTGCLPALIKHWSTPIKRPRRNMLTVGVSDG